MFDDTMDETIDDVFYFATDDIIDNTVDNTLDDVAFVDNIARDVMKDNIVSYTFEDDDDLLLSITSPTHRFEVAVQYNDSDSDDSGNQKIIYCILALSKISHSVHSDMQKISYSMRT